MIGPLAESELGDAAALLARAFRDNALNRAVVRGSPATCRRANEHGMRAHLPAAHAGGTLLADRDEDGLGGVLVAASPGGYPFPRPRLAARLRSVFGQGLGVAGRWATVYSALDARHPRDAHFYLGTLGVEPDRWGRGVGTRLLEHWLATVDREGWPAYLETDGERTVGFYERAGFAVVEDLKILGVDIWLMRRPGPRGA